MRDIPYIQCAELGFYNAVLYVQTPKSLFNTGISSFHVDIFDVFCDMVL